MSCEIEKTECRRFGTLYRIKHPSGLTILLSPMEGFKSSYALFGTAYGSVDTLIKTDRDGDFVKLPEGIAHYLEHKLFESEECSAFERYAKTGASANAFTAFDRTAYLFSCSDNFAESLEILLDFVTHPYFTAETVAKEQGIIGQEIRMYDDSADWMVLFNLLCALYSKNPVRIDIAGTQESISHITAELLYKCYDKFYNLHNMVLAVAGNVDVDEVIAVADKILKPAEPFFVERGSCDEPENVVQSYVEQHLSVSVPMFDIGFKGRAGTERENFIGSVLDEIFLNALFDDYSEAYRRMYDEGIINSTFGSEVFGGRDYIALMLSGESREPQRVCDIVRAEIENALENGLSAEAFECAQKSVYGRYLRATERAEGVATMLFNGYFPGVEPEELMDIAASATPKSVIERVRATYSAENYALSVIKP